MSAYSDFVAGLHIVLTLAILVGLGALIYIVVKDRPKIEAAYQNTKGAIAGLEQFGQTTNCIGCQICNSTNPTIQALVTATGICGPGSCINTTGCPTTQ